MCAPVGGTTVVTTTGLMCGSACPPAGGSSVTMRVAVDNTTGARLGYCTPAGDQSYAVVKAAASCFAPPPPQAPLPPGSVMCSVPLPGMPPTAEPTCFGGVTYNATSGR
jgi:hypothetical protein